jgi:type I site-specific restriction endonuclease
MFISNSKSCNDRIAVFQVQANNYATFYDDQMQNWSVMFESGGDAVEFAREVSKTEQ